MPHLIVSHERTWISTEDLRRELAEGALPETVEIEHAPWTGRESRPASEIDALSDVLQSPAAKLARRLSRHHFPWASVLSLAAVGVLLSVRAPRIIDLLDGSTVLFSPLSSLNHLSFGSILFFVLMMIPAWLAGRLSVLGPAVMMGMLSWISLMMWGTLLGEYSGGLVIGALCAAGAAAMGAMERIRPMLPPMRQDWGRWGWWALLLGLLIPVFSIRLEMSLLLLGLSALSVLVGWLLPSRPWQLIVGALVIPLSALVTAQVLAHPEILLHYRHTETTGMAGVSLDLPTFLSRFHGTRSALDVQTWSTASNHRWRQHPDQQGLTLTVSVAPTRAEPILPDGLHRLEQGVWHRYHTEGGFQVAATCESSGGWREQLCISLLEEATFATPFSVEATEALAAGGSKNAQTDHMVALFAAGQHADGWAHLRSFYPLTTTRQSDLNEAIWTYLQQHGECVVMESLGGRAQADSHRRRSLIESCLAEISAR